MKTILFLIIAAFTFFVSVSNVYAYDLEVQCGSEKCAVNSNEPVFPPSTQWTPNKTVEKSIIIKNTSGSFRDVFFKMNTSGKPRGLDKFMHLRFYEQGDVSNIWMGTLEDLVQVDKIPVAHLPAGEMLELVIAVKMDNSIPNEMQGVSSVFDFGFGFEEGNGSNDGSGNSGSGGTDNNNPNNDNSNNNTSSSDNNSGESGGGTPESVLGAAISSVVNNTGNFLREAFSNATVSAQEVLGADKGKEGNLVISGGVSEKCTDSKVWVLALLLQLVAAVVYFVKRGSKRLMLLQPLTFFISVIAVIIASCYLWPIAVSVAILAAVVLKYFNKIPRFK